MGEIASGVRNLVANYYGKSVPVCRTWRVGSGVVYAVGFVCHPDDFKHHAMGFEPPRRSEGLTNNRPSETLSQHFSEGLNRYKNK